MNEFNGFPATYQPQAFPQNGQNISSVQQRVFSPVQNSYVQNQQTTLNQMVWVQGEAGAKAYPLPSNTTLPLWDELANVIYIKSTDAIGRSSMTILDYTERPVESTFESIQNTEYVTMEKFNGLSNEISEIKKMLSEISGKPRYNNRKENQNNAK